MPESIEDQIADLEARVADLRDPTAAVMREFDKRLAAQAPPPPAPKPAAAAPAAPAPPADRVELAMMKLDQYAAEAETRDPQPMEYHFLGVELASRVAELREVVSDPASSMEERMIAREKFSHAWERDRAARSERVRSYDEERRAKAKADAERWEQHQRDEVELARRELHRTAEAMMLGTAGERFKAAVESGAIDQSDHDLRRAGWNSGQVALLNEVRGRMVKVEPSKVAGQGFQTHESSQGLYALVPGGDDVLVFQARYGAAS